MKSDLRLEFLHRMPLAPAGLALSTGTQDAVMTSAIMTILELIGMDADEVEAPEKGLADKSSRVVHRGRTAATARMSTSFSTRCARCKEMSDDCSHSECR